MTFPNDLDILLDNIAEVLTRNAQLGERDRRIDPYSRADAAEIINDMVSDMVGRGEVTTEDQYEQAFDLIARSYIPGSIQITGRIYDPEIRRSVDSQLILTKTTIEAFPEFATRTLRRRAFAGSLAQSDFIPDALLSGMLSPSPTDIFVPEFGREVTAEEQASYFQEVFVNNFQDIEQQLVVSSAGGGSETNFGLKSARWLAANTQAPNFIVPHFSDKLEDIQRQETQQRRLEGRAEDLLRDPGKLLSDALIPRSSLKEPENEEQARKRALDEGKQRIDAMQASMRAQGSSEEAIANATNGLIDEILQQAETQILDARQRRLATEQGEQVEENLGEVTDFNQAQNRVKDFLNRVGVDPATISPQRLQQMANALLDEFNQGRQTGQPVFVDDVLVGLIPDIQDFQREFQQEQAREELAKQGETAGGTQALISRALGVSPIAGQGQTIGGPGLRGGGAVSSQAQQVARQNILNRIFNKLAGPISQEVQTSLDPDLERVIGETLSPEDQALLGNLSTGPQAPGGVPPLLPLTRRQAGQPELDERQRALESTIPGLAQSREAGRQRIFPVAGPQGPLTGFGFEGQGQAINEIAGDDADLRQFVSGRIPLLLRQFLQESQQTALRERERDEVDVDRTFEGGRIVTARSRATPTIIPGQPEFRTQEFDFSTFLRGQTERLQGQFRASPAFRQREEDDRQRALRRGGQARFLPRAV